MSADIRLGDYAAVLDDVKAQAIITSPPYNLGKPAKRVDGRRKDGEYDPKSFAGVTTYADNLPEDEYQQGQIDFLHWAEEHLADGGVIAYNVKSRRRGKRIISPYQWLTRVDSDRLVIREEIIWDRGSTHNHDKHQLWAQTERVFILGRPGDDYAAFNTSSREMSQRSDVWRIPVDSKIAGAVKHTAAFPPALPTAVIEAWTQTGDVICDPYLGSGTTAVAALAAGRRFIGSEMLPEVHAAACRRVSAEFGVETLPVGVADAARRAHAYVVGLDDAGRADLYREYLTNPDGVVRAFGDAQVGTSCSLGQRFLAGEFIGYMDRWTGAAA